MYCLCSASAMCKYLDLSVKNIWNDRHKNTINLLCIISHLLQFFNGFKKCSKRFCTQLLQCCTKNFLRAICASKKWNIGSLMTGSYFSEKFLIKGFPTMINWRINVTKFRGSINFQLKSHQFDFNEETGMIKRLANY